MDNISANPQQHESGDSYLAVLSKQIWVDLYEGMQIRERPLMELCKEIVKCFSKGREPQWPKEFKVLMERVDDYWRYELNTDGIERECSHARLYQIISLVKIYEMVIQRGPVLNKDAVQYSSRRDLLRAISDYPGITHKKLSELLDKTPSGLTNFVTTLEKAGYLSTQKVGAKKYYHLSSTGDELLELINNMKQSERDREEREETVEADQMENAENSNKQKNYIYINY